MRIALAITELHPGGAETCLVNLAEYLQRKGHTVRVWQLWPDPPEGKRCLTDRLDRLGIVWSSGRTVHAWDFPRALHWLRKEIKAFKPDIVQAFLFHANLATACATLGLGVPVFGGVRVRQPQRVRWWLQRLASHRMHKVICVSRMVADHCIRVEGISPEIVEIIPNGICVDQTFTEVSWSRFGIPLDVPVILFVGRLDDQKGVDELLVHADRLLADLPSHHLVLMGDGPLRESLQLLLSKLSAGDRVHLVGWQARAIDWMHQAQLLVLPAKYEGMPNVVLEAMLAGIPVAAFDVDGIRDLLGQSEHQIVPAGDYETLLRAIMRLATDAALRVECVRSNVSRVHERFRLEQQLARYDALYQQVIMDRATHGPPAE